MPISALPEAPSQSDPANFATEADAFVAALDTFRTEANALEVTVNAAEAAVVLAMASAADISAAAAAAIAATDYVSTSITSLTVDAGEKIFVISDAGALFEVDDDIVLISRSDPETRMALPISARVGTTITGTVPADGFAGTGPAADWIVASAAFAASGATAADIWAATSSLLAVSPGALKDALATVALTPGASVTPDLSAGRRFSLAPTGSFTLAAPTNAHPGDDIEIEITHGASSIVMAVNAAWVRQNGLGVLSVTSGYKDLIVARVLTVDGSNVATRVVYQVIRRPVTA